MASFAENQGARVFHAMMILPAGILLVLLSLISLSTLAVTNRQFTDEYEDRQPNGDAKCILYAERDGDFVDYSNGDECAFSIAGGGMLCILALAFTAVLVGKAIFGVGVLSILSLIELVMSVFGAIWAFIVSVVITAGLDQTCNAFGEAGKDRNLDKFPCCSYYYGGDIDDENNVYFYEGINASRITAWLTMLLLLLLAVVYLCIVIKYFCGGRSSSSRSNGGEKPSKSDDDPNPI